jgi:hypothetical protein
LYPASVLDVNTNIICTIVSEGFAECSKICNSLQEVCDYHTSCFKEIANNYYAGENVSEF